MKPLTLLLLTAACLAAFAWRSHDLPAQSLWSDEGLSLYRARQDAPAILANLITIDGIDTRDTNPPLYFLLLHAWRALTGETIFSLRYLGVLIGLLAIPLLFQLGRLTFGWNAGILAALLLALSPFHIWQIQELRNYSLLLTLNLLSLYGLLRALDADRRWLALWMGAGLLGIYTHYFGFFIFAFGAAVLTIHLLRQRWSPPVWVWAAMAAVTLALLPVLVVAWGRLRAGPQSGFVYVPPLDILSHAASVFSVGFTSTVVHPLWRVLPVLLLAAVGAGQIFTRRRFPALFCLAYLLVPLSLLILLSQITPLYNGPRHLFMGLPPFLLLVAAGLDWLRRQPRRWTPVLAGGLSTFLLISQIAWTHTQFTAPALVKDDVQGVAEYLTRVAGPADAIVLHDAILKLTFDAYYHGPAPVVALPRYAQMTPAAAEAALQAVGQTARRVWFLADPLPRDGFPPFTLPDWANAHWQFVTSCQFPYIWLGLNLAVYLPQPAAVVSAPSTLAAPAAVWTNGATLLGQAADIAPMAAAGELWWTDLYWQSLAPEAAAYTLSLRLTDETGHTWTQTDPPLLTNLQPQAGDTVRTQIGLPLPVSLPPGHYQVWLRLLPGPDQPPLTTVDGPTDILLQPALTLSAAAFRQPLTCLPAFTPSPARLGREIAVLGYRLPAGQYRPGHIFPLDVFWQALRPPTRDYQLLVQLLSSDGRIVGETLATPTRPDFPPTLWQRGQVVQGQVEVIVPPSAADGLNQVQIALVDPDTWRKLPVRQPGTLLSQPALVLDQVQVVAWPLLTQMPPISSPLRADFGQPPQIELHGYDLDRAVVQPGDEVNLTLYWRAGQDVVDNYVVLLHLADAAEQFVGQGDGLPDRGFRPTNSWRQGEVIVDAHTFRVAADAPAGVYRLWVGLYDPETFARMPAFQNAQRQPADRIWLADVQVEPAAP